MVGRQGWMSTSVPGPTAAAAVPDQGQPQSARMYDYYLGGKDHFEADRKAAEEVLRTAPNSANFARANRYFLQMVVEYLAREQGIDQFLDIGTGIPTAPNTHQIAQLEHPHARVLYTDNDPIVMTYAEALMTSAPEGRVDYIEADLRRPEDILGHACLSGPEPVFDLDRPVGVCTVAIFHFVTDEHHPSDLLRRLMEPLPSGSYLALSHTTEDFDEAMKEAAEVYRRRGVPCQLRSAEEIDQIVSDAGLEILDPGVRPLNRWWPGRPAKLTPIPLFTDAQASCYGLLARKP